MYQKNKIGQVSIFILIGIILVFIASLLFFIAQNVNTSGTQKFLSTETTESDSIKLFVQGCADNAAEQAVVLVGLQGGHIYLPDKSIVLQGYSIAYDYFEGQNLLPAKEQIETAMSKYVSETVVKCVDDGKKNFAAELEFDEIKTVTKIDDREISFEINYPSTIKHFEKTENIDGFKSKVDARLGYVLDVADNIVSQEKTNPNWVNISYLSQTGLIVELYNSGDYEIVYVLTDANTQIAGQNYTFVFANKFKENSQPDLLAFDAKQVQVGKEIIIKTKAIDLDGDELTFSGIDNRIMDEKTGVIRFMSSIAGTYTFNIKATDSNGDFDEELLVIQVTA